MIDALHTIGQISWYLAIAVAVGLGAIVIGYTTARAASLAFYKSKFEHIKRTLHLTSGDHDDEGTS